MKRLTIAMAAVLFAAGVACCAEQTDEAAAVFDGVKTSEMRGGTWKVVYGSSEGLDGKVLEVLTERLGPILLREGHYSTPMVLPLEKAGERPIGKRDMILVGRPGANAALDAFVKPGGVPKGGYLIRTLHRDGRNIVVLAGDGPAETLWATFDFLDVVVPSLAWKLSGRTAPDERSALSARYDGEFFRLTDIPAFEYATAPETPVRSVFSWGHVVDDLRTTFRELARARFNRAILWNDQRVVNAEEVVRCAHDWGVKVYWGFSWGWTLSGTDKDQVDFNALADEIVAEWRTKWKPMGGDGIYFQSFTETKRKDIGGRPIPEAVTELVNAVTRRIRAEAPGLDIVFGLHANSMRANGAEEALAKTDPSLEILWENCGGFPYWEADGMVSEPNTAFADRVLSLTSKVGFVWKAQLRLDWSHYVPPAGPFLLGCAGRKVLARDQRVAAPMQPGYNEDWLLNGKLAWEHIRHLRTARNPPREFNAVAEYNPPYGFSTLVQAELFWNAQDSWDEIVRRARLRRAAGSE